MLISDHAPIMTTIADSSPRGQDFIWCFPGFIAKSDEFRNLLKGWWMEYSNANSAHEEDPSLFWNAAKAVLRGQIIAYLEQEFELWIERRENIYRSHLETDFFRYGIKPGRLLANLAKGRRKTSHLMFLRD